MSGQPILALRSALLASLLLIGCGGSADDGGDADNDTISNFEEGYIDEINTDADEWEDWLDLDTDGDGIGDIDEAGDDDLLTPPVDTDGDGMPDFRDLDSDGDGVLDAVGVTATGDPIDTDGDGIPDYRDDDDDGDGIRDTTESAADAVDTDRDGIPDYLDTDSDGDGVSDLIEGNVDTDGDAIPDFRDLDSDNDGLADAVEDLDGDGMVTPCALPPMCETSRTEQDTDGDGIPDLIEVVAGSDPSDPMSGIPDEDFYFVLPFEGPTQDGLLDFSTDLRQADVFFSVDTTGSFGEEITAIQDSIDTLIVPGVMAAIPNPAFGVGRFEDFPREPFGLPMDRPFELLQAVTTDTAALRVGIDALPPAGGGFDIPEAGLESLYQWATGMGIPALEIAPFAPGDVGGAGFRAGSLPIIVHITDAASHIPADYAALGITAHGMPAVLGGLNGIGARVIGVRSVENIGLAEDPYDELVAIALGTRAVIPPTMAGECLTGIDAAARPPVTTAGGDVCPLVFDVRTDGTGLGAVIVDAIGQLATLGALDVSTRPVGELMGLRGEVLPPGTTTADFVQMILPEPPAPAGTTIDGVFFRNVTPGTTVQFRLTVQNNFVPEIAEPQLFNIDIQVLGDGVTVLDVRNVFVIVPPDVSGPIIF